jgi:F-box protein 9
MEDQNAELEAFRRKWREEVSSKSQDASKSTPAPSKGPRRPPPNTRISARRPSKTSQEHDHVEPLIFSGLDVPRTFEGEYAESSKSVSKEPQSALEHYEKAVERENQVSIGDSLNLYRKAFRVSLNTPSIQSTSD